MYLSRFILSAIVLVITNLIVGSISLSLGLIVTAVLIAVFSVAVAMLALLGFAVAMERMNWVRRGWTDAKIDRVKAWVKGTREALPDWSRTQKRRILDLLIEALREREARPPETARLTAMKYIVVGLLVLLSVTLLTHSGGFTVGWSLVLTALGALVVSVPLMQFRSVKSRATSPPAPAPQPDSAAPPLAGGEDAEAWKTILALHRTGHLKRLLDQAPDAFVTQLNGQSASNDVS